MKPYLERIKNGLLTENPVFVLMLGMCPTLAVTTSAINGFGMGVSSLVVLAVSNLVISLLRKIIPDEVRLPAFIVVVASFVTVVELLMEAYIPSLYAALGIYIPLIVVNCIILGRAEAYASKNPPIVSLFDGIGMGLGFTVALTIIGAIREILGNGSIFGLEIPGYEPMAFFVRAPGAFLVLAVLVAIMNAVGIKNRANKMTEGCDGCCASCAAACDKKEG
ncbi:MAG: electron transport complex subunit E [Candidatus Faecousia sp.]|nr:electron transport complex subunit E [Candidatus Faecousia sp.]